MPDLPPIKLNGPNHRPAPIKSDGSAYPSYVWSLLVNDPHGLLSAYHLNPIGGPQGNYASGTGLAHLTEPAIKEALAGIGVALTSMNDDDAWVPGHPGEHSETKQVAYFGWHMQIPTAARSDTDRTGIPRILGQVRGLLLEVIGEATGVECVNPDIPDAFGDWWANEDGHFTVTAANEAFIRDQYADLLLPLEGFLREYHPPDKTLGFWDEPHIGRGNFHPDTDIPYVTISLPTHVDDFVIRLGAVVDLDVAEWHAELSTRGTIPRPPPAPPHDVFVLPVIPELADQGFRARGVLRGYRGDPDKVLFDFMSETASGLVAAVTAWCRQDHRFASPDVPH